jgi:hypothetical protein
MFIDPDVRADWKTLNLFMVSQARDPRQPREQLITGKRFREVVICTTFQVEKIINLISLRYY